MKQLSIIGMLAVILSACMTQQKAVDYLTKKQLLPQVCADSFPVRSDTIIKEGETIESVEVWTDTLYVTDTIDNTSLPDTIEKIKVLTRVVTKYRVDTVVQTKENIARVAALEVIVADKDKEIVKVSSDRDKWKVKAKNRSRNQFISIGANILLIFVLGWLFGKKLKKTV
jgi:hypothetical protein